MDAQKLRSRRLEEVPPSRLHRSCGSPVFRLTCLCGKANSGASSWKPAEGSQRRPPETMHSQITAKSLSICQCRHSPAVPVTSCVPKEDDKCVEGSLETAGAACVMHYGAAFTQRRVNDAGGRCWDGLTMLMKAFWPGVGVRWRTLAFNIQALVGSTLIYFNMCLLEHTEYIT